MSYEAPLKLGGSVASKPATRSYQNTIAYAAKSV